MLDEEKLIALAAKWGIGPTRGVNFARAIERAVVDATIERCAQAFDDLAHPVAAVEIQKTIRALKQREGS